MMKWPPIHVARPNLPPLAQVLPFLEEIWDSRMLSNSGPLLIWAWSISRWLLMARWE